ncbi:GGDEF domain-containing protein [Vagococcus entomophilus]|uniref:GGDEF domain-containing protein n=1 Tax=Vagococcus entomophilus TaxID=1160095 RepID=A0A430AI15_9ENTE|nr:GGDEF domain-containing protein [Vagococcus entomophilus]RSU07725.1 hypothetical protein CBF30_00340 [Vagococcus entomophilus]
MISFINSTLINLSIIISSVLIFYFISFNILRDKGFSKKQSKLSNTEITMSYPLQIILGIAFGLVSFLLSVNLITVTKNLTVDMRYVMIFFIIFYGTILMGSTATITLILSKIIHYYFFMPVSHEYYINNFFFTLFVLFISIYLHSRKISYKKSCILFIGLFTLFRSFYFVYLFRSFSLNIWTNILMYFAVFSLIFLITSVTIRKSVNLVDSFSQIKNSATFDRITGLYNREQFEQFLRDQLDSSQYPFVPFSLILLDMDDFKSINDTYGHQIGDQALRYFSDALTASSTGKIYICRIGGDEFGLICTLDFPDTKAFLLDFQKKLREVPLMLEDGRNLYLKTSIGVAHATKIKKKGIRLTPQYLFNLADQALYAAKKNGKDSIVHYYFH